MVENTEMRLDHQESARERERESFAIFIIFIMTNKTCCCYNNIHNSSSTSKSSLLLRQRRQRLMIRFLLFAAVVALLGQSGSIVSWQQRQKEPIVVTTTTTSPESNVSAGTLLAQQQAVNNNDDASDIDTSYPPRHYDFLLNVPFYVYDNDLLWINKTSFGDNNNMHQQDELQEWMETMGTYKHSDDYWFIHAALYHPQRTYNPNQAQLFIVPILLNTIMTRYQHYKTIPFCIKNIGCEKRTIMRYMNRVLQESIWFQRHEGRDHIVVASHYQADYFMLSQFFPNIIKCNMITFEGSTKLIQSEQHLNDQNDHVPVVLPSMYVGRACPIQPIKTDDIVMIGSLTGPSLVHFKQRREMCTWLKQQQQQHVIDNSTTTTTSQYLRMTTCGQGEQCPTLAQARFGLHVRGDTFGANRLLDTLLSGTIPIFTWSQQYDILPNWIDWKSISYFANISAGQVSFISDINTILADHVGYQQKHALVLHNRDLFDWETPIPFDVYMYILSIRLWPMDKNIGRVNHNVTNRYPALILP